MKPHSWSWVGAATALLLGCSSGGPPVPMSSPAFDAGASGDVSGTSGSGVGGASGNGAAGGGAGANGGAGGAAGVAMASGAAGSAGAGAGGGAGGAAGIAMGSGAAGSAAAGGPAPHAPELEDYEDLRAVWGSSRDDIWIVGAYPTAGLVMHWDGVSWTRSYPAPEVRSFSAVWGTGPHDVWIAGSHSILHGDGKTWESISVDPNSNFNAGWSSGADDVWVAASEASGGGAVWHFDGATWAVALDVEPASGSSSSEFHGFNSIWGTGSDDVWVVGQIGDVYHFDGASWSFVPGAGGLSLNAVSGTTPNDVWIAAGNWVDGVGRPVGHLLHWDGNGLYPVATPPVAGLVGVWAGGPSDVWAVGGSIVHWNGRDWSVSSAVGWLGLSGVRGTAGGGVWAVGDRFVSNLAP